MAYTQLYEYLHWCALDPDARARTCGYWYTMTSYGATPHTAFRTRPAFMRWLEDRNLSVRGEVPEPGNYAHGSIDGSYRRASHMSYDEFYAIDGLRTRVLDNADYTLGIVSTDPDGLRTVHHLNPNCRDRPDFDYRASQALEDVGTSPIAAPSRSLDLPQSVRTMAQRWMESD